MHSSEDGSGEIVVVRAGGLRGGKLVELRLSRTGKVAAGICTAGKGVKVTGRDEHSDKHRRKGV